MQIIRLILVEVLGPRSVFETSRELELTTFNFEKERHWAKEMSLGNLLAKQSTCWGFALANGL
jgi:hypothetical protein